MNQVLYGVQVFYRCKWLLYFWGAWKKLWLRTTSWNNNDFVFCVWSPFLLLFNCTTIQEGATDVYSEDINVLMCYEPPLVRLSKQASVYHLFLGSFLPSYSYLWGQGPLRLLLLSLMSCHLLTYSPVGLWYIKKEYNSLQSSQPLSPFYPCM